MVESDFCANTGRADRGARSVDLWGGRGFCILGGAAGLTLDVDHSGEPSNLARLLPILEALDAIYRIQRRLRPTVNHLASPGRQNLVTRYGLVDLAGTVGRNLGYPECCPTREKMDIGEGARVRVLDLETLIVSKRATGQRKRPRRMAGPPADARREEKEEGGDSTAVVFRAFSIEAPKRNGLYSRSTGEGAGHLARNGCSNLKAPTLHRRPKLKAGRYAWNSGRVK